MQKKYIYNFATASAYASAYLTPTSWQYGIERLSPLMGLCEGNASDAKLWCLSFFIRNKVCRTIWPMCFLWFQTPRHKCVYMWPHWVNWPRELAWLPAPHRWPVMWKVFSWNPIIMYKTQLIQHETHQPPFKSTIVRITSALSDLVPMVWGQFPTLQTKSRGAMANEC